MNKFLIFLITLLLFTLPAQAYQSTVLKEYYKTLNWNYQNYTLTAKDIEIAEAIMVKAVKTKPELKDLNGYTRQYVGVITPKGEKIIWINCFYSSNPDKDYSNWKKEPVMVLDGGANYFSIKINLTTKDYYDFWVNGDA